MSFANLMLYCATLPSYDSDKTKTGRKGEEEIKADDPTNRQRLHDILTQSS